MAAEVTRGHRRHVSGEPRTPRRVFLSAEERAVIGVAADRVGLTAGAYIAASAVRAARADVAAPAGGERARPGAAAPIGATREAVEELRVLRRLMGNVAGNLNDVARHANSTGEIPEQTAAVLDFVRRAAARVDAEMLAQSRTLP